ncbi:23S rRNA (uracil-5-)-methyltransferase RumA, partial [Yersinia pestis PY-04]
MLQSAPIDSFGCT